MYEESFVFPRQIGTLVVLVVVCGDAFVPVLKRQNWQQLSQDWQK